MQSSARQGETALGADLMCFNETGGAHVVKYLSGNGYWGSIHML